MLPLLTIYLYSLVVSNIENKVSYSSVFFLVLIILTVRLVDNFLRLRSIYKLEECISNIGFDVHNYFIQDLNADNKEERHQSIQAIRNFSDASSLTLMLFRQPGIDSIVSLITIPIIFWFLDGRIFILEIVYIAIYMLIDYYTTQKYSKLKDLQNSKVETYYGKLQETNDVELEQKAFTRHFKRLSNWNFTEWFILQNTAVFFYCLILGYCIISVFSGVKQISDLVLVVGYVTSTQAYLNAFSEIKNSLADMNVAIAHLAKNKCISAIDLDDLV